MSSTVKISCEINTTDSTAPLGLEIWLDDDCLFSDQHVKGLTLFEHHMSDLDADHVLKFVMSGKTTEHTKLSETGEIVQDARLRVTNLCFDEIALGHVFVEKATYTHDFNGTGTSTTVKFFEEMGCNGTLEIKFSTPIYLWLLENL